MSSPDERYHVLYNGEVYNYRELRDQCRAAGWSFSTATDTEVVLAAWSIWGEAAITRFKGMFAFVVIDTVARHAWIARDPFGIKPLHYSLTPERLLVSSEIPSLLATRRVLFDVDPRQALEYLRYGASTAVDVTLLRSIRRLAPASVARFDFDTGILSSPQRYWTPSQTRSRLSFPEAVDECRARFLDNVSLHLRSDVPVGATLSGGLDSSSIICGVHHLEPDLRLNTFSFISADPRQSEERWVDEVNRHVNAVAHKVVPLPHDLAEDLESLIVAQGEPFGTASIYAQYRVFRMARQAGVPVTLDGQGADEILGGYWPFLGTIGASLARRGRAPSLLRLILRGGEDNHTRARIAAQVSQALLPDRLKGSFRSAIGRDLFPEYLNRDWFERRGVNERDLVEEGIQSYQSLKDHLIDSFERTSLPTLLRIADRSSMAFSVESRVPFLTHDFVDFLLSLPEHFVISKDGSRKHVLREAMRGIVPEPVRLRRDKVGFVADDGLWLRSNATRFESYYDFIREAPYFRTDRTLAMIRGFFAGENNAAQAVWRTFSFAAWHTHLRQFTGEV